MTLPLKFSCQQTAAKNSDLVERFARLADALGPTQRSSACASFPRHEIEVMRYLEEDMRVSSVDHEGEAVCVRDNDVLNRFLSLESFVVV